MKRYIFTFLLMLGLALSPTQAEAQLLDRVIAVVNNEAITQSELDMMLRPIYEQYKAEYKGDKLFKELSVARQKLLNQLIEDRLVFQEAQDKGIQADNQEVDIQLEEFKSRFPNEQVMEEALKMQGITLRGVRERLEKQSMIRRLHQMEVRSRVVVSPTEIEEYYKANKSDFSAKDRVKIRSLTIKKSQEARDKGLKDETAWELVSDLYKKVEAGERFEILAREYSEDMHAEQGGLGEWVDRGTMIDTIDSVIFKLKAGQTSEIIETTMGYHFFRVEERKDGIKRNFEQVREEIQAKLYQQKSQQRFSEWMDKLKRNAYISVR